MCFEVLLCFSEGGSGFPFLVRDKRDSDDVLSHASDRSYNQNNVHFTCNLSDHATENKSAPVPPS